MPELPEVETIRRQLERSVKGKRIVGVDVLSAKKINVPAATLIKKVRGAKIVGVDRRAKLLMIKLSNKLAIAIHLKMTGRVLLRPKRTTPAKHTFVILHLSNDKQIMWEDYRRFGFLKLLNASELDRYIVVQKYGPEPLAKSFSVTAMTSCLLKKPRAKIKQLLMEQRCVAGLGNIYAAEALWSCRVRPDRPAGKMTKKEYSNLWKGIRKVLTGSIKNRGTSADAYVDANGKEGTNVANLKVYGREGRTCLRRDGGIIKKAKLAGRGTYWCPKCQK